MNGGIIGNLRKNAFGRSVLHAVTCQCAGAKLRYHSFLTQATTGVIDHITSQFCGLLPRFELLLRTMP